MKTSVRISIPALLASLCLLLIVWFPSTGQAFSRVWSVDFNPDATNSDSLRHIALLDNGDFIAAGSSGPTATRNFIIYRLRGTDGSTVWSRTFDGGGRSDSVTDLIVDPATGDTYISGHTSFFNTLFHQEWVVMKFSGSNGSNGWTAPYTYGNVDQNERPESIAFVQDGAVKNIVVAGTRNPAGSPAGRLVKLNASTGALIWAVDTASQLQVVRAHTDGSIFVGGETFAFSNAATITKFNVAGVQQWTQSYAPHGGGFNRWNNLDIDPVTGDVLTSGLIAGPTGTGASFNDLVTARYATATGTQTWVRFINGAGDGNDSSRGVIVDGSSVFVIGFLETNATGHPGTDWGIARLSLADGSVNWTQTYTGDTGTSGDQLSNFKIVGSTLYLAGNLSNTVPGRTNVLMKLNKSDGAILERTDFIDRIGSAINEDKAMVVTSNGDMIVAGDSGVTIGAAEITRYGSVVVSVAPTVTTPTSTAITTNSATLGGNVTADGGAAVSARGIVLSPTASNNNPLIGGASVTNLTTSGTTGVFTLSAGSLTPNTAYSFKAYATNSVGTGYSSVGTFTTPGPNLTINDVTASEGSSGTTNFSFTVSLSTPAGPGGVGFNIATANGTAASGVDYVAQSLSAQTIPAASSTYSFTVQVNGDLLNEPNETFFVNVTGVTGAVVIDGLGVGTITNDDPLPSLSINDVSVTEGNSGTTNAVFTVTLNAASGQTVQVNYTTADDSATQPADYTATSGTLTFTSPQTTRTIIVPVVGDTAVEPNENYFVNLSGATNATIADNQGLGTITNDDTPALSIGDVSITEGDAGTKLLSFTVTRSANTTAVTFDYATADGTATNGSDYVSASGSGSFIAGGANTTTLSVTLNGDAIYESDETFVVNLSNPTGSVISDNQGLGTILNDDAAPVLTINDVGIVEGNSGTQALSFTVTRTGLTALAASFSYATADNTATAPGDYTAIASTPGSIAAGGASASTTIVVSANGDNVVEANETFFVNLSAPGNATIADTQGIGTIQNDDTAGITLVQSGGTTAVTEGGASDSYTLVLTSQPTANVSVALVGTQVGAAPTPVSFTPANWNVAQTVTVTAIDDAIAEGAHSGSVASTVSSSDPVYAGFAVAPVAVTITDNDVPGITVTQSGGTTVATEGGATDSYSVVLTSQPTNDVVIALSGTQVTPAPTPLTFTSGNWNVAQTVTVTAIDDAIAEGTHSGSVASTVTSGDSNYNAFPIAAISVSISDNDNAGVTITQTGTTDVTEGGATDSYSAVLTSQPTADVTITPSTVGEVSISPASRTFTAANWNVPQSFTVTATDDAIVEGAESATITHTSASGDPNYQGATVASVSAAISDNDSATVQFAPISVSQSESTSPMAFTVSLSAPVQSGVTLTVNSTPGSATAADFTAISNGTVTFAANSTTSQTVNVSISNDALDENDERFSLTLSGLTATGNVTLGAGVATATGTILDDDPTPTISVTSPSLDEGNSGTSVMNFVVSLNAVSGRDVTFTRATADGTATVANNDYVALSAATATIPAGQTSLTIPVTINGDTPYEGNETFSLAITGVSNATPATITGTGTIADDDQQPTTTTITGDTPDPTVVGQAYTVSASVVAQTTSPLGTVTISDGSASCTATLTAGTAPDSAMSCLLTSTSAGAKTLTASYTPASSAFAASSDTDTHQVNAAATTISVSGPARSRINQATSFSFVLGVTTPGAGTPTGVVTLSSGAATCSATLPATSCSLTFTTLGARTVTASYASDGNYLSSTSSGAGNAQTLVYALSDLSISKTDGVGYYEPGDLLVYSVIVRNLGPDDAANIRVVDTIPAGLTDVVWSCDASGGGVCPASGGAGNLDVVLANVRVGALLNFTFFGNVAGSPLVIANTASIVLPADTTIDDPVQANNSATDTDQIDFTFRDGFENPPVSAPSGSARIPALALARELGDEARVVLTLKDAQGEALRVYARLHDESLQYALARRTNNGTLRLEAWRSLPGEPTLSWSARAVATGWVMEAAELR